MRLFLRLLVWGLAYAGVKGVETIVGVGRWSRRFLLRPLTWRIVAVGALAAGLVWFVSYRLDLKHTALCADNMRQIYRAVQMYEGDHGHLPAYLGDLHPDYLPRGTPVLLCPAYPGPVRDSDFLNRTQTNYWWSDIGGYRLSDFGLDFILLSDGGRRHLHLGGTNHLLADGCVVWDEGCGHIPLERYLERHAEGKYCWMTRPCPHMEGREEIIKERWLLSPRRGLKINEWLAQRAEKPSGEAATSR